MPKLIIKRDGTVIKKLAVPADMLAFTVGYERGNDIIIKDEAISFFHMQFEKQNGQYYVRDLQSQWGTYVNGFKISTRTSIEHQDEIRLGEHSIVYLHPEETTSREEKTPEISLEEKTRGVPRFSRLNSWLVGNSSAADSKSEVHDSADEHDLLWQEPPADNRTQPAEPDNPAVADDYVNDITLDIPTESTQADGVSEILVDEVAEPDPIINDAATPIETHSHPDFIISEDEGHEAASDFFVGDTSEFLGEDSEPQTDFQQGYSEPTTETPVQDEPQFYLLGIYGYYLGQRFKVKPPETRIGRDVKLNDIVIDTNARGDSDHSVSRRHATIRKSESTWLLSDKRSQSRTRLNQRTLQEHDELPLVEGDEIEIASDQRNHIFRLVREGDWDFSFPRKAGKLHVRKRTQLMHVFSGLAILVAGMVFLNAVKSRHYVLSQPNPLIVDETAWSAAKISAQPNLPNGWLQPAISDFNTDEFLDVVYINSYGYLNCVDGRSKKTMWINSDFKAVPGFPITLDDLHGNGRPDVIVVAEDNTVRAIDGAWGIEIWKSPILEGPFTGPPVIADFNGDGLKDLAIASLGNQVHVGYAALKDVFWKTLALKTAVRSVVSAADVTNDGFANILIGTEDGHVMILDAVNRRIVDKIDVNEEFNKATGLQTGIHKVRFPVALGDLNGDKTDDLIVSTSTGSILSVSGSNQRRLWYHMAENGGKAVADHYLSLGDLDGDGLLDVVSQTGNKRIAALKGLGQGRDRKMLIWEYVAQPNDPLVGYPVFADFNKNGTTDVVTATSKGAIYVFEGATGERLLHHRPNRSRIQSQPMIADLDNDNYLDIITARSDGYFYKLRTSTLTTAGIIAWGQAFGDSRHTNASQPAGMGVLKYNVISTITILLILVIVGLNLLARKSRAKLGYY